jgi:hypothetical protein
VLTPSNVSDVKAAPTLLAEPGACACLLGDKGYDADGLRHLTGDVGAIPVFPRRRNRARTYRCDKTATPVTTSSRTPSAASRTSDASPLATTSSPLSSSQSYPS